MQNLSKINVFLASLNLILAISGYSFITLLFVPSNAIDSGASQAVTMPYRAFCFLIALFLIFFNLDLRLKINWIIKLFLFFWIIYIIRIFYDLELRNDIFFVKEGKILYYSFSFLICLIPLISVIFSYKYINFNLVLYGSLTLLGISMIYAFFNNENFSTDLTNRVSVNVALNPISYGEVGAKSILLGFFVLTTPKKNLLLKILMIAFIVMGFLTIGRAASRGPLVGVVVGIFFLMISKQKKIINSFFLLIIGIFLIFIFQNFLIDFLGFLSPALKSRVLASIYENDTSDRNILYQEALNQFYNFPLLGDLFVLEPENGKGINAHNIILDSLMGLGLIGGLIIIIIFVKSIIAAFKMLKNKLDFSWFALILIFQIFLGMLSNSFYTDQLLSFGIFICLYTDYTYSKNLKK